MEVRINRRAFLGAAVVGALTTLPGGGNMTLARRLLPSPRGGSGFGPPPYNEEFSADSDNWTIVGTGDINDTTAGALHLATASRAIRTSVPPTPFTVTAFCSSLVFDDIDSQFANASLAIGGNANPGTTGDRHYAFQWDVAFLGEIGVIDGTWDNYSSQVHQNTYRKLGDGLTYQVPNYQRLVVNSGHDISSYYSLDGETWTLYLANYDPSVDVEAVLLLSYGCTTAWDWVRFS